MWNFDIKGIVVNVVFPNTTDIHENFYSRMENNSGNTVFRVFYELTNLENGFYDIVEWKITKDLKLVKTPILIPVSLAYVVGQGTLEDFTTPIEYYYDSTDESVRSTHYNDILAKVIEKQEGVIVYPDFIGNYKEDYYSGKKIIYADYDKYVGSDTVSIEQLQLEQESEQ